MSVDNYHSKRGFYDGICTCKRCDHKMSRHCFKLNCKCCDKGDHSAIMDGIEGFEITDWAKVQTWS